MFKSAAVHSFYLAGWSKQLSGCLKIWVTTGESLIDVDVTASSSFHHLHCTDTGLPVSQLMNCHSLHCCILCWTTAVNHWGSGCGCWGAWRHRQGGKTQAETCKSLQVKLFLIVTWSCSREKIPILD